MSGLTATPATNAKVDPAKLATAARQFEALMIGQILKSSHGSDGGGWLGAGDDDDTSATAVQMAEEYLGQAIANGGGLGIAAMVIKGVGQNTAKGPTGGGAD
jgi:Rod binding domain-containing protein